MLLASCGSGGQTAQKKGAGGPPQVGFVVVQPGQVPVVAELTGRVNPYQVSEIRPQVAGIVRKRLFTEGTIVRQGQTLYQIDPSLYSASVAEAAANLQNAQANAEATRIRADRYKPLAEAEAVSKQDYTDAAAAARQARAQVAQTGAQLQTARINLHFTRVPAPITGRIGRSLVTEGALVTTNQADPLAVIQRLDPIFVDIQQSSTELLALRRALAQQGVTPGSAGVRLKLEDGSEYGTTGTVEFSEVMVDQNTGTVTLRARFANPEGMLLPGMFVRAVFTQAIDTRAFLVPQQAVSRDARGAAQLWVVGPDNKAVRRDVTAERTQGAYWVITKGLNPGDKVITQGIANLKPNADIRPVPADTPQKIEQPRKGQDTGASKSKGG
ncbi:MULTISPECIES: efflux RND transporter periplasmic adaptor subunit [unclassified Sphingomonas]|uniref:efflux RND transporter periplasmic adaptor subunit n=1 Tax=unclassified Sphingomonas TaxID=196159 RepID=UPI001ACE46B5|nr:MULTISPECIES: efflux RND transporter periplasmic adaptor subunit [unclassified Sphingomonas]MBN8812821.1 efflux RND transporter periplasmic adaptor subunit [Sphingomonas sp.]